VIRLSAFEALVLPAAAVLSLLRGWVDVQAAVRWKEHADEANEEDCFQWWNQQQ